MEEQNRFRFKLPKLFVSTIMLLGLMSLAGGIASAQTAPATASQSTTEDASTKALTPEANAAATPMPEATPIQVDTAEPNTERITDPGPEKATMVPDTTKQPDVPPNVDSDLTAAPAQTAQPTDEANVTSKQSNSTSNAAATSTDTAKAPIVRTAPECGKTITANVVAFDQIIFYNRLGSFDPGGMMYALKRDVVAIDPTRAIGPGNVQFRSDKRPRPLVLRVNEGDCLAVTFTNMLDSVRSDVDNLKFANWPAHQPYFGLTPTADEDGQVDNGDVKLSKNDTPATRNAGMHVNGLNYKSIASDGSFVGKNVTPSATLGSLVAPGSSITYTWYASKQGQYLLFSTAATSGGEGDGGQLDHGLFGMVNVEPKNSVWYRSQVTAAEMQAATTGLNDNKTPILNYEKADSNLVPILNMLKGTEIVHADINAIITDPTGTLQEDCGTAPPSGTCGQPFREFSVIFHDELETGAPAFPELLNPVFHGVRDGFGINYGSSGLGAEVIANRNGVGPQANCTECEYEEFFLESPSNSDPATLVAYGMPNKRGIAKAIAGLFPDDPSNVHHSYLLDPVRFRNVHAGPKETHVFHLHAHQWVQSPRDPNSTYLDSQTISPGASFTYEIQYGGGGNRNLGSPGDSIFHCHLYPHFAQGMWELWRNHDVFEDGTVGRNLPDAEIAAGIPQPALVPIPYLYLKNPNGTKIAALGNLPMPTPAFKGFPFYIPYQIGHRTPQAPLGREIDPSTNIAYGGLPRHRVLTSTEVSGINAVPADQLNDPVALRVAANVQAPFAQWIYFFAKKMTAANLELLPEDGTPDEKVAIAHHAGQDPGGTPITVYQQVINDPSWSGISYPTSTATGAPGIFIVNGRPAQPGAPYADPCPDTFIDDARAKRTVPMRKYRAAWVQLDYKINNSGWHDRQGRIAVLEKDVSDTLSGARPTEPMFIRANSGDCIDYRVTNLTRANLNLDDFQIFQGTDIIGQHIHLVKFDVTSSDGAGNGWNYESGGFSPEKVRERIDANNEWLITHTSTTSKKLKATYNPSVPALPEFLGAQTHIERWWADPLMNRNGRDRTLRTVFTHDHFSPSGHQHHGLYAGLVVEPTDATWKFLNGAAMGGPATGLPVRADGGPTSFAANIITGASGANSYREFMLEIGDFAIVYTADDIPVNPPNHKEADDVETAVQNPVKFDPTQEPHPESISAADPGTQVMNYRNEPIPLRIAKPVGVPPGGTVQEYQQKSGNQGDMAFAFSSDVHGDPATPMLPSYPGDHVEMRVLQGSQEEQHVLNVHGHKWFFEPGTPQDPAAVNNSGYTNSQQIGISEHFEFDFAEKTQPIYNSEKFADFLYQSAATDNLWDGMWGLLRTYGKLDLSVIAKLPNNQNPFNLPGHPLKDATYTGGCPLNVPNLPVRDIFVEAWRATDLVGAQGITYNKKFGFHDPAGIVFVEAGNIPAIQQGTLKLEPLVLRVNAGDCIHLHLKNNLPEALPEYDSWNSMPLIIPGFNFNQVQTSNRVSLHPQLLTYDVGTSDGAIIGKNPNTTVAPTKSRVYTWYAGKITYLSPTSVKAIPVEFGATNLRDYGDVIKHSSHGLVGSLIVEPANSTWMFDTGTVSNPTSRSSATVKDASSGAVLFKEFVVQYQSDLTMKDNNNDPMRNFGNEDDAEDSGQQGFNYKREPLWARLGLPVETNLKTLNDQDYTNTLSSLASNPGCGGPCGDPETPVFTATAGSQVRFRILDAADHPRQHGFTLFGHHWNFEPWANNSLTMGNNTMTFEVGSYSGIGPTRHLNILTVAGGAFSARGDYLYRTQESFKFSGGLWGIFRVQ
ncbi:MAG: manganese oxidase [Blastocatellia bacterium]|jgi:hypothetical protein|nr:manganese oxidase [Blastocatellia bacterium]